jgi:hypothetical protein
MKLNPLYRLHFDYPKSWSVDIVSGNHSAVDFNPTTTPGAYGKEVHHFLFVEGRTEGRISGKFHGAHSPRVRTDGPALTEFHGIIETDDGAKILFECHGYGRAYREPYKTQSPGLRQWVATITHLSDDERYKWLNDVVCVGAGLVRKKTQNWSEENPSDLVLDVAELVWEPLPES